MRLSVYLVFFRTLLFIIRHIADMIISDFFFFSQYETFIFIKKKGLKQHIGKFRKEKKYITSNKVSKYKYNHTENK